MPSPPFSAGERFACDGLMMVENGLSIGRASSDGKLARVGALGPVTYEGACPQCPQKLACSGISAPQYSQIAIEVLLHSITVRCKSI
jgi:hypothetical protein